VVVCVCVYGGGTRVNDAIDVGASTGRGVVFVAVCDIGVDVSVGWGVHILMALRTTSHLTAEHKRH